MLKPMKINKAKFLIDFGKISAKAHRIILKLTKLRANDTGDMYRSTTLVSPTWLTKDLLESNVFYDPTKLYKRRKKHKSSKRDYPKYPESKRNIFNTTEKYLKKDLDKLFMDFTI